jgi:acetamidase/formamidase
MGLQKKIDDISGPWIVVEKSFDTTWVNRAVMQVTGNKIVAQIMGASLEGTFENSVLIIKWPSPDEKQVIASYTGRMQNGSLVGEGVRGDIRLKWSAHRPATPPSDGPRTHTFIPTEFHRVFSSAIPPVLRIFPGDIVKTKSIDAGGLDENSVRQSMVGNPLTGPFYIEGALPGDILVVRLNRIRLNRDWALSGQSVIGTALVPEYLKKQSHTTNFDVRWIIDVEKGIAYLEKPADLLKSFTVPLQPMLGCVGVAPPNQVMMSSGDSGNFGGNMDYNHIREGATVYLPVFHEGALLFLGDGHAAQGDGELTGSALETSMEFEFTVDVIREKLIRMPRAENAEYLMAIGIGPSLDRAFQVATTEMARWLESDYKLNSAESAMVLGFSVKYDLAALSGIPVVVAKIPKCTIGQLKSNACAGDV